MLCVGKLSLARKVGRTDVVTRAACERASMLQAASLCCILLFNSRNEPVSSSPNSNYKTNSFDRKTAKTSASNFIPKTLFGIRDVFVNVSFTKTQKRKTESNHLGSPAPHCTSDWDPKQARLHITTQAKLIQLPNLTHCPSELSFALPTAHFVLWPSFTIVGMLAIDT
jgi:hypothetical protein